jgi:methanogen homocitrate synthase
VGQPVQPRAGGAQYLQPAARVEIHDATLRDGEQTPGRSFSASADKVAIAEKLAEIGVDRIEGGDAGGL